MDGHVHADRETLGQAEAEAAIAAMNDAHCGLTCSPWTADPGRAAARGARLQTGTVCMNRCEPLDPALCRNGGKESGRGGSRSILGHHSVTRPQSCDLKKVKE